MKLPVWATTTKLSFTPISKPEITIPNKEWIGVGVTFGDPRRNCSGSGICQIMGARQLKSSCCQGSHVNAFLRTVDNRHLQLIFDVRQLSLQEKKQYLTDTKMMVRTNLPLPLEVKRALGISENAIISPGEYLIQRDGYYLHHYVRFKNLFKRA
jgi:hypothetical protein